MVSSLMFVGAQFSEAEGRRPRVAAAQNERRAGDAESSTRQLGPTGVESASIVALAIAETLSNRMSRE